MTRSIRFVPFCFAAVLCFSSLAFAHPGKGDNKWDGGDRGRNGVEPHVAPEIDPSLLLSGLALIGGALAVQRARRSK